MDGGTPYQLQKLINKRNVKDPSKHFAACEEFFLLVVEAHVLAAAQHLFSTPTLEDAPSDEFFPTTEMNSLQQRITLIDALHKLINKFVHYITYM